MLLETILPEEYAFILGFSCTVWTKPILVSLHREPAEVGLVEKLSESLDWWVELGVPSSATTLPDNSIVHSNHNRFGVKHYNGDVRYFHCGFGAKIFPT